MEASPHIVEVSLENFQVEVSERSQTLPVLLEFYAEGAEQSAATAALLYKLASEYAGKFVLARVEVQRNPQLVQQLAVRTLPSIKVVVQGQLASNLEGPVDEAQLRSLLDQLTMSPLERVHDQVELLVAQGQRREAIHLLQQVIAEEPKNYGLHAELCDLLIQEGDLDEANKILPALPDDTPGIEKPKARLAFIDEAGALPSVGELEAALAADVANQQKRYQLAVQLIVAGEAERALEELLTLLKQDKAWQEELPRRTMIKVFDMLGKGNELATSYRRKLFTVLH